MRLPALAALLALVTPVGAHDEPGPVYVNGVHYARCEGNPEARYPENTPCVWLDSGGRVSIYHEPFISWDEESLGKLRDVTIPAVVRRDDPCKGFEWCPMAANEGIPEAVEYWDDPRNIKRLREMRREAGE